MGSESRGKGNETMTKTAYTIEAAKEVLSAIHLLGLHVDGASLLGQFIDHSETDADYRSFALTFPLSISVGQLCGATATGIQVMVDGDAATLEPTAGDSHGVISINFT